MLRHGILGLLGYGEMTGYEIREVFAHSLNYFWTAQTSQIYRELDTLRELGYITQRTQTQAGRPDKNVCAITPAGRQELLDWLAQPAMEKSMRSGMLMKVFFLGELSPEAADAHLAAIQRQYEAALTALAQTGQTIASYAGEVDDPRKARYWRMTADYGVRYMQMTAQWARDCRKMLAGEGEERA